MYGLQLNRAHESSSSSSKSSSSIVKSGILYKKTGGIMVNTYKKRLMELTTDGELICYEIKANGQQIEKDSIFLTPTTRIEKRTGVARARRNAKFIIHIDHKIKWYLWCNNGTSSSNIPISTIYKYSPKSRTNPVNSTIHYNNVLFPYHQYHHRYHHQSPSTPSIPVLSGIHTIISVNIIPPEVTSVRKSSYTSLTSIKATQSHASLGPVSSVIPPIKLNANTSFYDRDIQNGIVEAQGWCDVLNNFIGNMQHNANQQTFPLNDTSDIDEIIELPWTLKQCYMMLKIYRCGYRRNVYKSLYFVLRMNGMLDFYQDESLTQQKGCIDILNECRNVEKRCGSHKRDCKFVIITEGHSYYFWCKDDKNLSMDWYYLVKRIVCDKMKNINEYLKIAESTIDEMDIDTDTYHEKQSISLLDP